MKGAIRLGIEVVKASYQLLKGVFVVRSVPQPLVTVFGSSKLSLDSVYVQQAYQLATLLAQNGIAVITGGGPGIMEAANCGAYEHGDTEQLRTIGIGIKGVDEEFVNRCSQVFVVNYFFIRKWLLVRHSLGFIFFPGGIGTMDELFDLLNLRKHSRIPSLPIVLIGKEYWQPILTWFYDSALKNGCIDESLLHLFKVTDDIQEAFNMVYDVCRSPYDDL